VRLTNRFHLVSISKRTAGAKLHVTSGRVNLQLDLSYDSSVDDLITSLEGRKFNCITATFSSQNQQITVVRALGYQVKNWTISHNCVFRQYTYSEISNISSENTIVMDCPFLYFDIHASERGVFASMTHFIAAGEMFVPIEGKVVNIHLNGCYLLC
jgi:hypothetical protein